MKKAIWLILIPFLVNSCASNPPVPNIQARELFTPVKKPPPPKINALIPKPIALYIIDLDESVDKANAKILSLREIYYDNNISKDIR